MASFDFLLTQALRNWLLSERVLEPLRFDVAKIYKSITGRDFEKYKHVVSALEQEVIEQAEIYKL